MNKLMPKQRALFDALHEDKVQDYKVFSKRDYGRLFSSLIDKYPESAHFVYELLQNAEDANATQVNIVLKQDRLIFKHNGTKHFDVTPLDSDKVGDINSITGFGFSSKVTNLDDEQEISTQKIGKFGVGFKSVFQYTDTPEIYDDIYCFKIENYIIPTLLDDDSPMRQEGETLFVFRFKEQNQAYDHIKRRLQNLRSPLLFLRNIKRIVWSIDSANEPNTEYTYEKQLVETHKYDNITLERYRIIEPQETSNIFLFSQDIKIEDKGIFPIYVGYYYDEKEKRLITDTKRNIYCFFPTKISFNTCFIAHAPFLLTDNRQDLKPDTEINEMLVSRLATLSAKTVVLLRDYGIEHNNLLINENITEIIPQYEKYYRDDESYKFEKIIQTAMNEVLQHEPLLLSRNNKYLKMKEAYTTTTAIFELLTQEQFVLLHGTEDEYEEYDEDEDEDENDYGDNYRNVRQKVDNKNIDFLKWELRMRIFDLNKGNDVDTYKEVTDYSVEDFAIDITAQFMDKQSIDWVTKFYTFLRNDAPKFWKNIPQNKATYHIFRRAPIIKTQNGKWMRPFINATIPNVFLPLTKEQTIQSNNDYNFIHTDYLKEEMAIKFFNELELKSPDEYDYITSVILNRYRHETVSSDGLIEDFCVLVQYYSKVRNDEQKLNEYIAILRKDLFLCCTDNYYRKANKVYYNLPILKKYFHNYEIYRKCVLDSHDSGVYYLDENFYRTIVSKYGSQIYYDFFNLLGVANHPRVLKSSHSGNDLGRTSSLKNCQEKIIDTNFELEGLEAAININNRITTNSISFNKKLSLYLWNEVIPLIDIQRYGKMTLKYREKYARTYNYITFDSDFLYILKNSKWLYDKVGHLLSPDEITQELLATEYNQYNGNIQIFNIRKAEQSIKEKYGVTDKEEEIFNLGDEVTNEIDDDFSKEEVMVAIREAKAKKKQALARQIVENKQDQLQTDTHTTVVTPPEQPKQSIEERLKRKLAEKKNRFVGKPHSKTDNGAELPFNSKPQENLASQNNAPFFVEISNPVNEAPQILNETARAEKNLKTKNTKAQEQAETAGEQVEYLELLNQTPRYTFKWFQILIMLMHAEQDNITKRRIQIDFSRYELVASNKILHLTKPTMPVPRWVCDAEKYSITALANGKSAKIDGLIVKTEDDGIDISIEINERMLADLKQAKKIRLIAIDNTNIIDSLDTRFLQLEKEDDFDMNANLPNNISFIYGPPGTGKTTELVRQVHDILEQEPDAKILVLTPTNKAADVVAVKMANDDVCECGLARYGATESLYLIEDIGCVTNRDTTDMSWHNIVVATAARYAYDFVQPDDTPICDYPWDYIFIDEASMIDILTITYIIYKGASAKKIIISGDPMQIRPVVQNDMPDLNIYDMVNMHGFSEAIFDYDRFEVKGLTMQHRSIPVIGKLVSNFAYDGLVDYDPNRAPMKPLKLDGLQIRNINFVGFDVAELDDIKGLNTINDSAFNLYSVIFTYNMVEYTIKQIEKHYPEKDYSIGIVCAYRAQSDAIKNMLENRPLDTMYCKVTCGTVHSFQGDECDIMFIVLNPPAICTKGAHVNNENIINVAMSRARDYIFFVMPNGQQKGFFMKNLIGKNVYPTDRTLIKCSEVERLMFHGNDNFIYENTHVTCHMPVNVYCEDNALYEVRISDNALDIKMNQM